MYDPNAQAQLSNEPATLKEQGGGLIDAFLPDPQQVYKRYQLLQKGNQRDSRDRVIKNLINQTSLVTGGVGAGTSVGGFVTMVFLLPVDIVVTTRIEAELVYMIAFASGIQPDDPDLKMMVYWIMAGETAKNAGKATAQIAAEFLATSKAKDLAISGAKEVGKEVGLEAGKSAVGRVNKLFKKLGDKVGRKAIHKAGRRGAQKATGKIVSKAIPKLFAKIFPVVGLVIGFVVNFFATQAIGNLAKRWFEEREDYYGQIEQAFGLDPVQQAALYGASPYASAPPPQTNGGSNQPQPVASPPPSTPSAPPPSSGDAYE